MRLLTTATLIAALGANCWPAKAEITKAPALKSKSTVTTTTFAKGLVHPWGMAFLPDGRLLVTERPGRMRLIAKDGQLSPPLGNVPAVYASGQGGLLDVALAPNFAASRMIYFSYSEPRGQGSNGTTVARAKLAPGEGAAQLQDVQVIFRQEPATSGGLHFGSRLAFARDGNLFVTLGERFQRDKAQDLSNHYGKVIRIRPDGSAPPDNPFAGKAGARPEVWSYGHRNVQSAAIHPVSGKLWTVEHGARGGDEINIPQAGKNYGWPVITYGRDYSFLKIGEGTAKAGLEQPVYYWDPSIAPSGMAFYTGDLIPEWKGNLFVGALAGQALHRLVFYGEQIVSEERLLGDLGARIRDVRSGPDGALWLLTDSPEGGVLRLAPPS